MSAIVAVWTQYEFFAGIRLMNQLASIFVSLKDKHMGPTGFDSKEGSCACMPGGECTSASNSLKQQLANLTTPWLLNLHFK